MFKKVTKLLASTLVLTTLLTSTGISAFASGKDIKQVQPITTTMNTQPTTPPAPGTVQEIPAGEKLGDKEPQYGVKTYLLRLALQTVAAGIRYGGDELGTILARLSPNAAKAFKSNASSIANRLDYIATWSSIAEESIRMNLYYYLMNHGVSAKSAMEIASIVAGIINALA